MTHHVLSLASRLQDEGEADGAVSDDQGSDSSWCEQSASKRGESTEADGAGEDEGSNEESEASDISNDFSDAETTVDEASDDDETSDDNDDVFCEEDYGSHGEQQSSHRRSVSLPHGTRLELAEALFQLSMMFWTHQCQTGVLDSSALVHFTAVMGIHRTSLAYRSAYNYTPSLAALMWVGRLFFLEYALPLCCYETLVYVWPARNTYPSQPERLQAIRTKYMLRGCHTPIGEILELKAFGKSIIKREGYRSNLTWSLDGQSFTIGNDKVVHLSDFCTAHRDAIWRVQEQVDEMMLGWKPTQDLSTIADDLTNKVPGWCFLDSPENGFVGTYKAMTRRAWLSSFRGAALAKAGQWLSCSCLTYLEAGIELATKIFVALHLTAGLPGRGTEITSIRLRNTKLATRNVFVREGQMLIVISYSKSRTSNNHAFYTVRYLPKDLACSVLAYLTYIRPFIDFLANRLELPQFWSNQFLFPDPGAKHSRKHLTSTQATAALRLFTSQLRTPWTLSLYRQAAIAIAKRYISELIKKKNFYYPTGASAPVNMIAAGAVYYLAGLEFPVSPIRGPPSGHITRARSNDDQDVIHIY
ncbi:ATP-dependent DNA helicase pfh1 [Purpureocillium lavendulum]|uniref:ATP-dependent DNA helicase pfh1 n=1 Tax=Purpureocillium lavendulum TaxID=1247861 RepID=A0AB34FBV2_9HYPO|nr:ATP-dependent DNA helicase pfh1 [Purpureocillium lavendulum]